MLDYLQSKLNDEQYAAAVHTDTSSLILAWAWSGKTRTLTYKISYLIFWKKVRPNRILAVTFTNKAANEMKERLLNLAEEIADNVTLDEKKKPQQDSPSADELDFDALLDEFTKEASAEPSHAIHRETLINPQSFRWIGTFHSTFLKFLKEEIENLAMGYTRDFGIYDSNETMSIIKKIIKDKWMADDVEPREAKGFISKMKNEWIPYTTFTSNAKDDYELTMSKIYELYQKELMKANSLDFDDLLLLPYLLFKKDENVLHKWQNKFDYIMVDEAQDTNWIQFELMRLMSGDNGNITLIGDDFQSIYGWRGALMENFLNVKKYWNDIKMFKLQINYRSKPHIVTAWSHIIKNNSNQYSKDIKPHREGEHNILVFTHNDQTDEAINTIDLIKKFVNDKGHRRSDYAILYRTNAQSSPLENVLVQEWVPYKIYGAFKFFERKEIKDTMAYLKYMMNPRDNVSLKRIINVPGRKIGKTTIGKIEEYALLHDLTMHDVISNIQSSSIKLWGAAIKAIQTFAQIMQMIRNELPTVTPSELIAMIVNKIEYKAYLVKEEGNEQAGLEKYENIGQLINMAEKYEGTGEESLRLLMDEIALLSDIADQEEDKVDAVKLMTVHSSKGLEFKHVFIVGLEENIFPLSNARLETKLLEEERRLMYVAITRAEDHLFLSHANSRMQWGKISVNQPSRFIDELPANLKKNYDLTNWKSPSKSKPGGYLNEWDRVSHKLFGEGELLEIWNYVGLVRFADPKFGLRKIPLKLLKKA